jgi:hypothetical protein
MKQETINSNHIIMREFPLAITHNLMIYQSFIDQAVDQGAKILYWTPAEDHDGSAVSPMLLRHLIELIDAVGLLIRSGSSEMAKHLMRSAFETNLYIHYIQEKESDLRAYAFLMLTVFEKIKRLERLKADSPSGIALRQKLDPENIVTNISERIPLETIEKELAEAEQELKQTAFIEVLAEYNRMKGEKRYKHRDIKWHELFGGPSTVSDLASYLQKSSFYEILYKDWSGLVHGTAIFKDKMSVDAESNLKIHEIRMPRGLNFLTKMTCNFAINTFGHYVNRRHPHMLLEYNTWQDEYTSMYGTALSHEHIQIETK